MAHSGHCRPDRGWADSCSAPDDHARSNSARRENSRKIGHSGRSAADSNASLPVCLFDSPVAWRLIMRIRSPKSVGVYRQYKTYAASYGLNIKALGNKVKGADDIAFLRMHCKDDLLGCFSMSPWVRRCDRGGQPDIAVLEPDNCQVIQIVLNAAMRASRDWQKYWHWGIHFHRKNAFA
jgi:hypothetical protein